MKKLLNKIKNFLFTEWTTVWSKQVEGYSVNCLGTTIRNVPMIAKLQVSNKNTYRFVLSDGSTSQQVDAEYICSFIDGALDAVKKVNRNMI